ncbi:MAG: hypothetical protein LBR22_02550 [Desulfovibrio sp.]|jgi:hypothetical protein|nr:hypothetical protein [Desulfovibrio sp.]
MPYPVAVAILKPMVEEFLRKRLEVTAPDTTQAHETTKDRHPKKSSPSSKDSDSNDCFPAMGKLVFNIDDIPIHVTFAPMKNRYIHISLSGRVEAVVPTGSRRNDVLDFLQNNIDRVHKSIDEVGRIGDISEVMIYDDGTNRQNICATNEAGARGLKLYIKYINGQDISLQVSYGGDVILGINNCLEARDIAYFLKQNFDLVQKKLLRRKPCKTQEG